MSYLAVGAAVVAAGISAATTIVVQDKQQKAAAAANKQATQDENVRDYNAKKAATFAQTEGQGQGSTGTVNLQVDKNVGTGTINDTKGLTL